jgi:hypothetical protein
VPQGSRDWIERIGDAVFDPAGDGERFVPTSARLNMAKWRQIAREHFAGHQMGDLVVYRWDTPRPGASQNSVSIVIGSLCRHPRLLRRSLGEPCAWGPAI